MISPALFSRLLTRRVQGPGNSYRALVTAAQKNASVFFGDRLRLDHPVHVDDIFYDAAGVLGRQDDLAPVRLDGTGV